MESHPGLSVIVISDVLTQERLSCFLHNKADPDTGKHNQVMYDEIMRLSRSFSEAPTVSGPAQQLLVQIFGVTGPTHEHVVAVNTKSVTNVSAIDAS